MASEAENAEAEVNDSLGALGEIEVLSRIFPRLPTSAAQLLGPGDDAAVLVAPDGRYVVTTDMMIHGPDFRLAWSSPHDLGWKAAASNLADIAAMGAVPTGMVVAISAPPQTKVSFLEGIADGFRDACERLAPGSGVVGGDLSASPTLTIVVTAFGDLEGREPVLRSGAQPGDIVAVCGDLGQAAKALRRLFDRALDSNGVPDARLATGIRHLTSAQLAPSPPIAAGKLAALGGATAMLDLSDGLAIDAARLAKASGVTIDFNKAALGPHPQLALEGGEDHALLATFPTGATLPEGFRRIGTVVSVAPAESQIDSGAAGRPAVLVDGHPFIQRGWDPFTGWDRGSG